MFFKWAIPGLFLFPSFKQTSIQSLQEIYVKNVHPVYVTGIRTHDHQYMSILPELLDQGSRPIMYQMVVLLFTVN